MKRAACFSILVVGLGVGPVWGQSGPVLKPEEVTESALVKALVPDGVPPARPRGFQPASQMTSKVPPPAGNQLSVLITFETDSAELTSQSTAALDKMAKAFQGEKLGQLHFLVEGHADPRGGKERNLLLSQRRAEAVAAYLVEQGVEAQRLNAVGKGDSELLNKAVPSAPVNRRVTFKTVQ